MNPRLLAHRRAPRPRLLGSLSDEELAELIAHGHEEAFEALVTRHRRVLLNHCSQLVGRTDAEEAVQEALLRAYLSLSGGHSVQRVSAWLRTIAHNTALNLLRARGVRPAPEEQEPTDVAGDPFEQREQLRVVLEALGSLPERQREALVMRELEGRSYAEIESRLATSNGAVRQLLNRARARLRTRLGTLTGIEPVLRWIIGNGSAGSSAVRLGALGGGCAVTVKLCATALLPATLAPGPLAGAQAARVPQRPRVHAAAARTTTTAASPGAPGAVPVSDEAQRWRAGYVAYYAAGAGSMRPRTGQAPAAFRGPTNARSSGLWTGASAGGWAGSASGNGGPYEGGGGGTYPQSSDRSSAPNTRSSSETPSNGGPHGYSAGAEQSSGASASQTSEPPAGSSGSPGGSSSSSSNASPTGSTSPSESASPGGSAIGNSRPAERGLTFPGAPGGL